MSAQTLSLTQPNPAARMLAVDALFCTITGTVLVLFSAPLADLTGIPAVALLLVGIVTLASGLFMGLFMGYMARQPQVIRPMLKLALAVNVVWLAISVVILLASVFPLTGVGVAAIIGIALIVEAISIGQWRALR